MISRLQSCVCVLAIAVAATACSKEEKQAETARQPPPAVSYFQVDPATAASLHGKVTYRGPKPPRTPIAMDAESACVQMHAGKPAYDQQIVVGQAGGVARR